MELQITEGKKKSLYLQITETITWCDIAKS